MAFGWSGAGAGASDALQQLIARRMAEQLENARLQAQQQQQAQQAAQFDVTMGQRKREFDAEQADLKGQRERQAAQDDIAAADRRGVKNKEAVRSMAFEGLMKKTTDPRTAQLMAAGEGVDIDPDVLDPERKTREQAARDKQLHQYELEQIGAQGAETRRTEQVKAAASGSGTVSGPYANERAARTIQSVDELMKQVSRWTTGAGSLLSGLPETDARSFRAQLDTLKANIAFNELAQMRAASKTGGALGAVSERELGLLESTLGALDQAQRPEDVREQLQKVRDSVTRWQMAQGGMAQPGRTSGATGGMPRFEIIGVK